MGQREDPVDCAASAGEVLTMIGSVWFDEGMAQSYESWYEGEGRRADILERELLNRFLQRFPGVRTILEVGCGTGHFTRWFDAQGLWTVDWRYHRSC